MCILSPNLTINSNTTLTIIRVIASNSKPTFRRQATFSMIDMMIDSNKYTMSTVKPMTQCMIMPVCKDNPRKLSKHWGGLDMVVELDWNLNKLVVSEENMNLKCT
uniref:Uncharacterized protein n=1 Tax=Cacopsylla melanoneura TaxID=428564 RepID=A0A8D9B4P3_9HEMI